MPTDFQNANLRTIHTCVQITVHNCCTQHSTEQFWLFSLLNSRQSSQLRCHLLEMSGPTCYKIHTQTHRNTTANLSKVYKWTSLVEIFLKVGCCRTVTVGGSSLSTSAERHMKLTTVWDGHLTSIITICASFRAQTLEERHKTCSTTSEVS